MHVTSEQQVLCCWSRQVQGMMVLLDCAASKKLLQWPIQIGPRAWHLLQPVCAVCGASTTSSPALRLPCSRLLPELVAHMP